jgi:hypothetical protein
VWEQLDEASAFPQFDIVTIDKLPGLFLGLGVIDAIEGFQPHRTLAATIDEIDPVLGH